MDSIKSAKIRPGALSLVLKTARIAGLAPLSFKKQRDGYSISVSRFQLAYSFFVITAFNVVGIIAIFLVTENKVLVDVQPRSGTVLSVLERMSYILASGMAYMGAVRMKHLINHINILEKIRAKTNYGYKSAKEYINVMWISSLIFILNIIFSLLDIMLIMLRASEYDITTILMATPTLQYNILILLKIQVVVINFEVYKVLLELNARLRYTFTLADSDQLTSVKTQAINNEVRSLTQCYVSVCEVVRKINNTDGLYMFLVYTCFALFSVFDGYRLILALNQSNIQYRLADIMLQCTWCIMIIVRIFFFVEPYQRISAQIAEMKVLLSQLMYHMTPLGKQVSVELDIMIKQVTLNEPIYCLLGIITLNRSLITTTLNVITTFLVFMVQLKL